MSHLKDRVIMITGVGSGFGALLAEGSLARGAKVVALDLSKEGMAARLGEQPNLCLLYTSPSPRDQRGARMPSSA